MHKCWRPKHTLAYWYTCLWIGYWCQKDPRCSLYCSKEWWKLLQFITCVTVPRPQYSTQLCPKTKRTIPWSNWVPSMIISNCYEIIVKSSSSFGEGMTKYTYGEQQQSKGPPCHRLLSLSHPHNVHCFLVSQQCIHFHEVSSMRFKGTLLAPLVQKIWKGGFRYSSIEISHYFLQLGSIWVY